MKLLLSIIAAMLLLSSCVTENKVRKWNNENLETAAEYCVENFPPRYSPPDTVLMPFDTTLFNDMVDAYTKIIDSINSDADSLIRELEHDEDCKQYQAQVIRIRNENVRLRSQLSEMKPTVQTKYITITVRDSAEVVQHRERANRIAQDNVNLRNTIIGLEKEVLKYKGQSKTRLWMFIAALLALALLGFLFFKGGKFLK